MCDSCPQIIALTKTQKETKPKPRTTHISVYIIWHNCGTQYSTEQF